MLENVQLTNMVLSDNGVKGLQKTESSDRDGVVDLQIGYKTGQIVFEAFGNGRSK